MAKRSKPPFDLMKIDPRNMSEDELDEYGKLLKKETKKVSKPGTTLKDLEMDDRFTTLKSGRPKKPKPPRGSGKYMTQFEKDMNKAKKEGNVKEQKRLERVKKSIEANIKKFGDQSKNVKKPGPKGPRMGVATGRRAKNVPTSILKRMNMGGVMRGRGGTFKGVF
tara:strand:+ start:91 stop:585 length:495 start_codon:yes stop_codon:yes gene_type:complete